jgi:hypothetical protein
MRLAYSSASFTVILDSHRDINLMLEASPRSEVAMFTGAACHHIPRKMNAAGIQAALCPTACA